MLTVKNRRQKSVFITKYCQYYIKFANINSTRNLPVIKMMNKVEIYCVENLDSIYSEIMNSRRNYFGTFEGFEPEIFLFYKLFHSTRVCFEEPGPDTKFISKIEKAKFIEFFLHTIILRMLLMSLY